MGNGYAAVHVETAGLERRLVEVAVVHLDGTGRRTDEWCTLVNPRRELGELPGIDAADVHRAPDFAGVAGELAARLSGRVLVAHDLPFALRSLAAEFHGLGYELPESSGMSTRDLAPAAAGTALQAARASARALVRCLDRARQLEPVRLAVPRTVRTYAVQRSGGVR
ncbi:hypothetical protein [Lentzea sp. NPDC003310]|uniref:3'-5' exonuclease n=1 Tax=Lentzea sp. NPDC003310 TaxID=3154447 RepID=UPI0033AF58B3